MADSNSSSNIGSGRFEAAEDNALVWSVCTKRKLDTPLFEISVNSYQQTDELYQLKESTILFPILLAKIWKLSHLSRGASCTW